MRTFIAVAVVALAGAVGLSSCGATGPSVRDSMDFLSADKEWERLYEKKLEARRAGAGDEATLRAMLTSLSERAEIQANALKDTDPATAVSFYRIAATSAWQAGPPRDSVLVSISESGGEACEKLPERDASQPRDCAAIRMPVLAVLDANLRRIEELRDAGPTMLPAQLDRAEILAREVAENLESIQNQRALLAVPSASFDNYVNSNLVRGFCVFPGLVGRFSASSPPAEQKTRLVESVQRAQSILRPQIPVNSCQ